MRRQPDWSSRTTPIRDKTGGVQWNRDALSDEPDVAALEERPPRHWPGWLVRLLIALGVVAVALFVFWRLTADQARAEFQQVRMVSKYAAEIDVATTNLTSDELYVLPRLAQKEGFLIETPRVLLGDRRTDIATTRVTVVDCTLAAAHASEPLDLALLTGPYTGTRDTINVRGVLPTWSALIPPVCDDSPDRGIASVSNVRVVIARQGEAQVAVQFQNSGGRPLTYARVSVPKSLGRISRDPAKPDGPLKPGQSAEVVLRLARTGCTANGDGPVMATMTFLGGEDIQVQLDGSWTNLLGVCPAATHGHLSG